jgi:hypothetical protein
LKNRVLPLKSDSHTSLHFTLMGQGLAEAVSAEELARYLDLKKLDERVYMFEAVSAYDG